MRITDVTAMVLRLPDVTDACDGTQDTCLVRIETDDGIIMGLKHRELPVLSVQFHPESILTLSEQNGLRLIHQAIEMLT